MIFHKHKWIIIIIAAFLFFKILTIGAYKIVWWDSAVYIGMGKYIYSLGRVGLWENSRPIVWPLILGLLWKLDLSPVFFGRVAEIIFGSMCILLTYLIGKKIFNEKAGLLACIFLACSPTFFFFDGIMLTEVVSTFFALLGVLFIIRQKNFLSGLFFAVSFMARFLQMFAFLSVLFVVLAGSKKARKIQAIKIIAGFSIPVILYLILNLILYNDPFLPFLQQAYMSRNSGWSNYHSISFYFAELFNESLLYPLSFFGAFLAISKSRKSGSVTLKILPAAFLMLFLFFNFIKQKEMRFLIVLMPYMCLLIAFFLYHLLSRSKGIAKKLLVLAIIASFVAPLNTAFVYYQSEYGKNNEYIAMQEKLKFLSNNAKVWISSPAIAAFSDIKIESLVYYPVFNGAKKAQIIKEAKNADFIFLGLCDLGCSPNDFECELYKKELLSYLIRNLDIAYSSKEEKCRQYIFERKPY